MRLTILREVLPFSASCFCTYLVGIHLYSIAQEIRWFAAIPFWLLGIGIGFACGALIPGGCVRAIQRGGVIGALLLAAPLIANSLGFALVVLAPFIWVYGFLQGAAARSGAKYMLRRRGK
jgi:hypothetical protein